MKTPLRLTLAAFVVAAHNPSAATLYVSLQSTNPVAPFATWETAAMTIQDAVDAAQAGDTVLVTNGVYVTGVGMVNEETNRVVIAELVLESVNGPEATVIDGGDVVRCAYVGDNALLSGFTLTRGRAGAGGGAAGSGTVTNCVLRGNRSTGNGGGSSGLALYNCVLADNVAAGSGGGAYVGSLHNCVLTGNTASSGGGASGSYFFWELPLVTPIDLRNCTLTGNFASAAGGGVRWGTLYNCLAYFNESPRGANHDSSSFEYSCTTPLPQGPGNIDADPRLASATHLSSDSPCLAAGSTNYVVGVDIDGEAWADPPAIGADQLVPAQATGPLTLTITTPYTKVAAGYPLAVTAQNTGRILRSTWDFGDGTTVTNQAYTRHAWAAPGIYPVHLTGYNDNHPQGVSTTLSIEVVQAVVVYVNAENPTPAFPFTSWATAATNIQDAVAAVTLPGSLVLVTNGVYRTGSVETNGLNRVALTNAVVVRSVNGPSVTTIEGAAGPADPTGQGAVRCAYVGNEAVLSGFTLTGGHAAEGGGAKCWPSGVLTNCVLLNNLAGGGGGGASGGILRGCELTANSAFDGGGASGAALSECTLTANTAYGSGGGAIDAQLYKCSLTGNTAGRGAGACRATPRNCVLSANRASELGGGAYGGTLYNSTVVGNTAGSAGGGVYGELLDDAPGTRLYQCTLTDNSAPSGGGVTGAALYNCLVYFNRAQVDANHANSTFDHSCTTPLPPGDGNLDTDPRLASSTHLSSDSPCLAAGNAAYASGVDIDGEPWAAPPSIGADELIVGAVTGPLTVDSRANYTKVTPGYPVTLVAHSTGLIRSTVWDFADGTVVTNQAFTSHAWSVPGDYLVHLTGYNDAHPTGVSTTFLVQVVEGRYYVNLANPTPAFPYTNWATAAATLQEAVAAGAEPGRVVWVADGVYQDGAFETNGLNRVALTDVVTLRSVNGPAVTIIEGAPGPVDPTGEGAIRCVYVGSDAELRGFTLRNGHGGIGGGARCEPSGVLVNCVITRNRAWEGGGVFQGTLSECLLTDNSSSGNGGGACISTVHNCVFTGNSARWGGGASGTVLRNSVLVDNSAEGSGGGSAGGTLYNCTLTGNRATEFGGGSSGGTLYNCLVNFNQAHAEANCSGSVLEYSCTIPLAPGTGNIDADPLLASAYHLSSASPCAAAGSATYAEGLDIDGEPWANPPSIGADQLVPGNATGAIAPNIVARYRGAVPGYPITLVAQSTGRLLGSVWDFGDGARATNQAYVTHAWQTPGSYSVQLTAFNDSHPEGVSTTLLIEVTDAVHYVNVGNTTPVFPYSTWATAATNIQDAVAAAAAVAGSRVLVTNGVYRAGSVTHNGLNRVALTNAVMVQSVNGPEVTAIEGAPAGGEGGDTGIRCAYVGAEAILSGFSLSNGHANQGGGACCEWSGRLTNCVLAANSAGDGGGVYRGVVVGCTLAANSAGSGGGASGSDLRYCTLKGNSAVNDGGGVLGGTLQDCVLTGNTAPRGGGSSAGTLVNCILASNSAQSGGGAYQGSLRNCILTGNKGSESAPLTREGSGGGANRATLDNCTVTGNSGSVGGVERGTLRNSIVYFNQGINHSSCTASYSCTTPLPPGPGNLDADPLLVSSTHLSPSSPCIGAGSAEFATGLDIDGEPWANPPSIGADEFVGGNASGPLSVQVEATYTQVNVGYLAPFVAHNTGPIYRTVWDFGDGVATTNQAFTSHTWAAPGTYVVRLTGYNDSHPEGVTSEVAIEIMDAVFYVDASNRTPVFPFASWATAATSIQDAVEASQMPGRTVRVTNGIYRTGIVVTNGNNRVALTNAVLLQSVNGPAVTIIEGAPSAAGSVRCVYLGAGAIVSGFTLTNGSGLEGGAVWSTDGSLLTNCLISGNRASWGGGVWSDSDGRITDCILAGNSAVGGGGVYRGVLSDCKLIGNQATRDGGGAYNATLHGCTLANNTARNGGGAAQSFLRDCTLRDNTVVGMFDSGYGGGAYYCHLRGCRVTTNAAYVGGGTSMSTLDGCFVFGNSADAGGGVHSWGADFGAAHNCLIVGNFATNSGGGVSGGPLYHCTVVNNSAGQRGGGIDSVQTVNCIIYNNHTPRFESNYTSSAFVAYSCTTPILRPELGNISDDPLFVDPVNSDYRLRPSSPCIDAGTNLVSLASTDLLGLPRSLDGDSDGTARTDMGAYEFNPYRFEPILQLSADGFQFTVRGEPDKMVRIDVSADLIHWESVATVPIPASGQTLIDPAATTEPFLFYRAVSEP